MYIASVFRVLKWLKLTNAKNEPAFRNAGTLKGIFAHEKTKLAQRYDKFSKRTNFTRKICVYGIKAVILRRQN